MEIYLIRHTAPDVAKGICYGQADIDVKATFFEEAAIIKKHLPQKIGTIYSSPLQRCKKLAEHLFMDHTIHLHNHLQEINCGQWEMKAWDDLPREEIDEWMNDFVTVRIPGGESYEDLYERVKNTFLHIHKKEGPVVIVAHGGVIRSILSYITNTVLKDSFTAFPLHYGCVIKITNDNGSLAHQILSNIMQEKETHKPSYL
jgi:alpha-ribazole phosphatase